MQLTKTRFSPIPFLLFALALIGVAMTLLPQLAQVTQVKVEQSVPHWLDGSQTGLREGLRINEHAAKHQAQQLNAWRLRQLLSQGQCVASRKWCGAGEKELYICADPVSGLIGGLLVVGDQIVSGYAGSTGYWQGKVAGSEWGRCDGREYVH